MRVHVPWPVLPSEEPEVLLALGNEVRIMAISRLRRVAGGAVLASAVVAAGLSPVQTAVADPVASSYIWKWGYYGTGAQCQITASMGRYSVNGKVNLRGTFHGCAAPRNGAGYGVLTVMATSPVRMGGSVGAPVCAGANYCTKTVAIPFTGTKTYCGHVSFQDDGHFRRHGRDPYLYACAEVSR
ncbi:hypothetical protein [Kribbella deserti]|uniref:Secreted protein n=1 Tax=Kribbella deserti TaxID=1926257 RepID=A0ABV6QG03_9ACTN